MGYEDKAKGMIGMMVADEKRPMGFSYNGIHCEEMGLTYIPDAKEKFFLQPSYTPQSEDVTGRAGGYWYGNNVKALSFDLEVFFDELTEEQMEQWMNWVHRDTEGELVFDDRPYVSYHVHPSDRLTGKVYKHLSFNGDIVFSGTSTIKFTCYEVYGVMAYKSFSGTDSDNAQARTGIVSSSMMPSLSSSSRGVQLVYNCGTEVCPTVITIGGTAPSGVVIHNYTTGESCRLVKLPPSGNLVIDSNEGSVRRNGELEFEWHDLGFIHLAPCIPYRRNVFVNYSSGSNTITSNSLFQKKDIGRYIYVYNGWKKIQAVSNDLCTATVNGSVSASGRGLCMIACMNEIAITGNNVNLTTFSIDYLPRVR